MLKRTIAILIAALIIVASIPVFAFAASPSPTPQDKYTVDVKSDNPNAGSVTKTRIGQDKWKLVATPNKDYKFVKWEITGGNAELDPNSTTGTVIVTVKADTVIKAVFDVKGSGGSGSGEAPETGDSVNIAMLAFVCVVSLAGAAFVAKKVRA